jgi:O-antigen ligase
MLQTGTLRLRDVVIGLAALLLAALPFRVTVDKRGGLLALIVLLLIVHVARQRDAHDWRRFFPQSLALRAVAIFWIALSTAFALLGPDPLEALRSVRSDILGPMLAFCVFHYLTRNGADLARWALVCAAAQALLTILMLQDPYQPTFAHRPAYIDVGVAASWIVLSAAWLPVLWSHANADGQPAWMRAVPWVYAALLIAAALASYNRIVWVSFAVMIVCGVATWWRTAALDLREQLWRRVGLWTLASLITLGALGAYSINARAPAYGAADGDSAGYVRHDPRVWIWPAGVKMAAERPLTGFGFGTEHWKDEFARRNGSNGSAMRINHAHNTLLNQTLQMGIAGGVAVLLVFAMLLRAYYASHAGDRSAAIVAGCGVALVVGFFVRNITDDHFLRQPLLLFAAMAGALLGAQRTQRGTDSGAS